MKLLTATRERQGERDGDFCFAVEGALVLLGFVCATDEANPDGGCGCGRAFSGMSSMRATTTAVVRDLDVSFDALRMAVEAHLVAAGMGPADSTTCIAGPYRPAVRPWAEHRPVH